VLLMYLFCHISTVTDVPEIAIYSRYYSPNALLFLNGASIPVVIERLSLLSKTNFYLILKL